MEAGFGVQFGDGSLLDFVGDCIESAAVVGGDGEGDHAVRPRTSAAAWGWWCRKVALPAGPAAALRRQSAKAGELVTGRE